MEEKTNFYRFRNTRTNYLLRPYYEVEYTNEGYHVYQSPIPDRDHEKYYNWLMMPTGEEDNFFIINMYSGFALFAAYWGKRPDDHRVFVGPLTYTGNDKSNIRGFFWRQPENPGPIINSVSGYALLAGDWGRNPDNVHVIQASRSYNDGDPKNDRAFIWQRFVQGGLQLPELLYEDNPGYRPRLESEDPPDSFPAHLAKTSYIPCWMVNDPQKDFQWKLKNSPYYALERRKRYYLVGYQPNPGKKSLENWTADVTTGFTKGTSETFQVTTGITTTVETEAGIPGLGTANVSVEISLELGFSSTTSMTVSQETTLHPAIDEIPPGSVGAIYGIENEYTLRRADGTLVKSPWVVRDGKGFLPLVYPEAE